MVFVFSVLDDSQGYLEGEGSLHIREGQCEAYDGTRGSPTTLQNRPGFDERLGSVTSAFVFGRE